jgi:hypothetical protein
MEYTKYMTHNELLKKIDSVFYEDEGGMQLDFAGFNNQYRAIRSAVELHSEQEVTLPDGEWGILCDHCSEYGAYVLYPCKTIRAIEKELV